MLAIVALTIFSVLRRFRPSAESVTAPKQQRIQEAYDEDQVGRSVGDTMSESLLVPRYIMEWLFPFVIVLSIYLLIRGHDLPGGGFAAGITASIAIILQYMASGTRSIEQIASATAKMDEWLLLALAIGAARCCLAILPNNLVPLRRTAILGPIR